MDFLSLFLTFQFPCKFGWSCTFLSPALPPFSKLEPSAEKLQKTIFLLASSIPLLNIISLEWEQCILPSSLNTEVKIQRRAPAPTLGVDFQSHSWSHCGLTTRNPVKSEVSQTHYKIHDRIILPVEWTGHIQTSLNCPQCSNPLYLTCKSTNPCLYLKGRI